jgi:hypothetical protein
VGRGRGFRLVAALIGVVFALSIAELMLRISGRGPWHICAEADEPVLYEPDTELGWKGKAGSYEIPPYRPGLSAVHVSILPDGARASGSAPAAGPTLVFVGGSNMQGMAIPDEETLAWKIQERFPTWRVRNLGTGAYGTYQSLLMLQRAFREPDPPKLAFYGFDEGHEGRNVAHPLWLQMLSMCSRRGMVEMPYCTLDGGGKLLHHTPKGYPTWPLRGQLASVALLQDAYAHFAARDRPAQARPVTEQLLVEMDRLAKQHGAHFCAVLLDFSPEGKAHYTKFFAEHGIDFVDCAFPLTKALQVPGEGHPNGAMNSRWAECVAAKIPAEAAAS